MQVICCSEASKITTELDKKGVRSERWGLFNGWDFDKDEIVLKAQKELAKRHVRRTWVATPCTQFCTLHDFNMQKWNAEQQNQFRLRQHKARRLNKRVMRVVLSHLSRGASQKTEAKNLFYREWPRYNRSWKTPEYAWFRRELNKIGVEVYSTFLDD